MKRLHRAVLIAAVSCLVPIGAVAHAAEQKAGNGTLTILSAEANSAGTKVLVRVRWHRGMRLAAGENKRFSMTVIAHRGRRKLRIGLLQRAMIQRKATEVVPVKVNARVFAKARRVTVTATQKYDHPADGDHLFERNAISLRAVKGKAAGLNLRACTASMVVPNADLSDCDLFGAILSKTDLSGVSFRRASLQQGSLAGSDLETTDLTSANLIGTNLANAKWPTTEQSALTFPRDGEDIVSLIATAETSVDVVIYDFGGPNLVGQPSQPGALMKAVQNGVNVRVILNAGQECSGTDPPSQSLCAGQTSLDPLYATQAALEWAKDHPAPGKTGGEYRVQFSSQNYQITHQKSVLIDTSNSDGSPRTQAEMTPNSKILVSTGNLQAYPVDWGRYMTCSKGHYDSNDNWVCDQYSVVNADYLENPAASCTGGTPAGCAVEWAARDFAIEVTEPALLERIAAVFGADQTCQDWNDGVIYQGLLTSDLPDTWANGTLLADGSRYPEMGTTAFYGGGPNPELQEDTPQGNSRERQLALIASADNSLRVYNEEMADPEIANALVDAADRGVDVRVVMASKFTKGKPSQNDYFDFLTANGVKVNLLNRNGSPGPPPVYYIHAKAIIADGTTGFMGSENFGYSSLNYNRELGLMLTNQNSAGQEWLPSVEGIAAIMTAFEQDWSNPQAFSYTPQKPSPTPPLPPLDPTPAYSGANMLCEEAPPGQLYDPVLPNRTSPTP